MPYAVAISPPDEYRGYLNQLWTYQQARYELNWRIYTGDLWRTVDTRKVSADGVAARMYRLGTNEIALACSMHAQLLFGEVKDNADPLVSFKVSARRGQSVDEGTIGRAQDFLDELWHESAARRFQFEAGLSSQITGGTFWRVRYALDADSPFDLYPFKFETIHADYVFPVFSPGTTRITEIFVRYELPREAARAEWGVWSSQWPDLVEYQEHWTSKANGMPGTLSIKVGKEGDWKTLKSEKNPFGFVPFVYIPHIPSSGFYGVPLAEWAGALDLSMEYNERLANVGDVVKQNSYPFGILKGHPTGILKPPFKAWRDGPIMIDVGTGLPGEDPPDVKWFEPAEVTGGTMDYLDTLKTELRLSMAIPPVAVGEDEGSQRSSLTLLARMFPLKSHVSTERWLWSSAMELLNKMAISMAATKMVLSDLQVRQLTVMPNWAPMFPRDRAELVNELVQRAAVGHVHPEEALAQYEDVSQGEVEETFKRIQQYREWEAELNKPEYPPPSQGTSGKEDSEQP